MTALQDSELQDISQVGRRFRVTYSVQPHFPWGASSHALGCGF